MSIDFNTLKYNLYTRRILSAECVIINNYLQNDLKKLNLWDENMSIKIMKNRGSIQNIEEIPLEIRNLYKTAFEIKQKSILDLARARAPFIDQTQSMNLFFEDPTRTALTSCHVYSWKIGLKTGMYYLRRQPKINSVQFTIENKECTTCSA